MYDPTIWSEKLNFVTYFVNEILSRAGWPKLTGGFRRKPVVQAAAADGAVDLLVKPRSLLARRTAPLRDG